MGRSRCRRFGAAIVVLGVLSLLVTGTPSAVAGLAAPSPRMGAGMAYDAARGRIVLFGGCDVRGFDDTWTWNGTGWRQRTPVHFPTQRCDPGMAYDAADRGVVPFGGSELYAEHDTWTWDGSDWTLRSPAHSPSHDRIYFAMAYDKATGQVLLLGGESRHVYGDTWTWNGTDWRKLSPAHSPPARQGAGMVYDAATRQVVLFGGWSTDLGYLNDTWVWNGTDWNEEGSSGSVRPVRVHPGMAYDAADGEVVLFGGEVTQGDVLGDTWTWDGGTGWTQRTPAHAPSSREAVGMAYDAASREVVLFGGIGDSYLGDTWTWDGTDWTKRS